MEYLGDVRRADPHLVMEECKSIITLGARYPFPKPGVHNAQKGKIAAYAMVEDYHHILPQKLRQLCEFIERETGHSFPYRVYTDTGPLLERDLAQRAGLGWIGKNTCLINPEIGSSFFLCEILLGIELRPDSPFTTDRCGTCQRCIDACPTSCILPDRTIDAGRCISYLTIENKGEIPIELRPRMGDWTFGCDICQEVCPWNERVETPEECLFPPTPGIHPLDLVSELSLTAREFNQKYKTSPILRARRGGYLRNVSVVLGNQKDPASITPLEKASRDEDARIMVHARWALDQILRQ